ncbi:MAG: DHA2 family efflux MFS transporter permease subunit [Gemmatimonadaceae bacterium]|nr:DHA2 family efflux MFS transporter permease subunit [Gemmatimonadaceae bacterium]NUO95539.1 DHA2 family efflux MFS transporter permease subunit [Gemmatimonadaceae bacterium]NUR35914.1 DHA2 family efflux MFS transporter permease subunit [Gemmatimonadaceae bacterium]NUS33467.1 DHA2 family efflux MFS transporter permease subunit [Gemmatimonadaceae bacterium]NUS47351.1 DHA2 family efflux MFS transporter permease subunit [Gemmatimonadaceae bacterium]
MPQKVLTITAEHRAQDAAAFVRRYRWLILAGLITAAVMEVLDTTIINVALPQMAGNLGATQEEIGWVSTGYILSNVIFLPMTAFFAGRFGRQRYLTFSIALFIVASFFCGTSGSLVELVVWRILQGAGGAALLSTAQATLRQIFPREEQGMVQAIFMLGIIVAPTLGPTLGGWITDNYTWNWCFFINVPIGILSMFLVSTFLQDPPDQQAHRNPVDWIGIGLLTAGVGGLQYVLEEGNAKDWFDDMLILRLAILSGICLIGMVWWELSKRNKHPVVNFRVLHNRTLSASIFLFVSLGFGLYGGVFLFPMFAQGILHFTPTETGLAMLPGGLATGASALVCGFLLNGKKPLADPRVLIAMGIALFAVSMWKMGHLTTVAGEGDVRAALLVRGFGLGMLFTPINNVAYASLEPGEAQQAAGLINLSRQLGGSFGIAVLANYVAKHREFHQADLVSNLSAGQLMTDTRLQMLTRGFIARGMNAFDAKNAALQALNGQVLQQSSMLSFNDAWLFVLLVFVLVSPSILLLRRPKGHQEMPADAH